MKKDLAYFRGASISLALLLSVSGICVFAQSGADSQLVYQLQQLQDEVRQLRGLVEQQSFELENLKRRQRDQYVDLDQRIADIQQSGSAPVVNVAGNAVATPQVGSPATAGNALQTAPLDVPEVRAPVVDQREVTTVAAPVTGAVAEISASPETERAAYDNAFSALKDLRYADSAQAFTNFIEQYPGSEYADNAQYWLGESFYAAGNYDLALGAFRQLLSGYPNSTKTADALLKIGYSHYEKKEWPQARAALEQVKADYPDTTLSRLAESRLRNMRLEGNF